MADLIPIPMGIPWDPWDPSLSHSHAHLYYKVYLCESCQQQSYKALIGLSIRAKMISGEVPFYVKIWRMLTHPLAKRRFSIYFRS